MTTTSTAASMEIAVLDPQFSDAERYALGAFLAGYRGQTREAYALDLRQFVAWCDGHDLKLFAVRRADIECFARNEVGALLVAAGLASARDHADLAAGHQRAARQRSARRRHRSARH